MYLLRCCHKQQLTEGGVLSREPLGFSLLEALIAALFFSVSLLGLLQYQQALLQGFSTLWQQRQAWSLLHQHIESIGDDTPDRPLIIGMKPHWSYHQSVGRVEGECTEHHFILAVRHNLQVELSRWFCSGSES
ncbi:prepilin-type N-terminal cleavage/methylation domain-containing protein [Yersinia mollaretii]|uniref:Prepilin peptidase dependent protein C n=1 Tax=Yersinia mollaretii TaxID=33060 RepID=A0AA36LMF6_YERMO|nr:prepilin peptidase dependent protein C [Yersinia mollaretii]CNI16303.1 prepilin peptidase dependent protein C [Yersinia mollaretii]CQJ18525.1 prepilin peptidase dependent protein C [Yersinia mollaretii]